MLITIPTTSDNKVIAINTIVNEIYNKQVNVIKTQKPTIELTEKVEEFLIKRTTANYHSGLAVDVKNHIENDFVECICIAYDGKQHYEGKSKKVPLSSLSNSWIEFMKPAIKMTLEKYKNHQFIRQYVLKQV